MDLGVLAVPPEGGFLLSQRGPIGAPARDTPRCVTHLMGIARPRPGTVKWARNLDRHCQITMSMEPVHREAMGSPRPGARHAPISSSALACRPGSEADESLDVERAEAARAQAQERMKSLHEEKGFEEAHQDYVRAVTRLAVARHRR